MIRKTLLVVAVLAIGAIVAAPAHAGGSSGTKKTVTMRVKNTTAGNVAVLPNAATSGITPASTLDQYRAAGGQFIGPNAVGVYKVAAGNGTFTAVEEGGFPAPGPNEQSTCNYVATNGRIGYLVVQGSSVVPNFAILPSTSPF